MQERTAKDILTLFNISPEAAIPNNVATSEDFLTKKLKVSKPKGYYPEDVNQLRKAASDSVNALFDVIRSRDKDVQTLANELGSTMADKDNALKELEAVRAKGVEVLSSEVGGKDSAALASSLKDVKGRYGELESAYRKLESAYGELEKWADEAEAENSRLREETKLSVVASDVSSDKLVAELRAKVSELEESLAEKNLPVVDSKREKLEEEIVGLREKSRLQEERIDEYRTYVKQSEEYVNGLTAKISELESTVEELENKQKEQEKQSEPEPEPVVVSEDEGEYLPDLSVEQKPGLRPRPGRPKLEFGKMAEFDADDAKEVAEQEQKLAQRLPNLNENSSKIDSSEDVEGDTLPNLGWN